MMQKWIRQIGSACKLLILGIVFCGVVYPAVIWSVSHLFFSQQAEEAMVSSPAGDLSLEAGQTYREMDHLWGRPQPVNGMKFIPDASGELVLYSVPANNTLNDPEYEQWSQKEKEWVAASNPDAAMPVPVELYTASGSGMDPDISLAAATYQIPRLVKATGLSEEAIEQVVANNTKQQGFGEAIVNVNGVNLELDALSTH